MHECEICGFQTGRLDAFKRHKNRKNPCSSFQNVTLFGGDVNHNVTLNSTNVTQKSPNVTLNSSNVTLGVSEAKKALQCDVCLKVFSSRAAKSRHKKNVMCEPHVVEAKVPAGEVSNVVCEPISPEKVIYDNTTCPYCEKKFSRLDSLKRHMISCHMRQSNGNITNNNNTTNNTTNNNNNITNFNNITINTINLNSYDNPSVDHVDMDVVKDLYYKTGRNLKKLIHEGVRKIWETNENNSFNIPSFLTSKKIKKSLFQRNETIQVYSDGDHRMLPANHVVDVVLQKAAAVCESHLRRHHYDDNVRGHAVLKHADVLEGLAIEYQETWDEDKKFRDGYKPFVQNALIECMLAASRKSYDSNTCEEE